MKHFASKIIGATCVAALMVPTSALALDAREFADSLSATINAAGSFKITFVDAEMDGNNVVLSGLDVSDLPNDMNDKVIETSVTFTNVVETGEGGYTADQALFENLDIDKDGIHLVISDMSIDDIRIYSDSATNAMHLMRLYSSIKIGATSVAMDGENVFRIDSTSVTSVWNDDETQMDSNYLIAGIYGDLSKIDDSDAEEILGMLDLTEINATIQGHSTWDIAGGIFSMPESSITIDQIGRLNIGMDLAGYTEAFAQKIQDLSRQMNAAEPEAADAMGMQLLLSMAADLSFGSLNIRFDDDSVTNKVMDFIGQEEGLSRKGMISTVAQILPAILGEMEIPELQAEITDAVLTFLRDPQSIEIDASPAEPVPFMALMAVAQNPSIAKSMLNLSITANQPE